MRQHTQATHGHAVAMPKGRAMAARDLRGLVEGMKASGFVAQALARSNQPDAVVAPAADRRPLVA